MKRNFFALVALAVLLFAGMVSCGDDKNDVVPSGGGETSQTDDALNIDYSADNAEQWGNYMVAVASLLQKDATTLHNDWSASYQGGQSYADIVRNYGAGNEYYPSAISCIDEILQACAGIADEVGGQKIGEPYRLYQAGRTMEALYAVESWFSYHSIEDYSNNIRSIRNAYYGVYEPSKKDSEIVPHTKSMSALVAVSNAELDAKARRLIQNAIDKIEAIENPFRDHIVSRESDEARSACSELKEFIDGELIPYFDTTLKDHAALGDIINQFVDGVILPTYKDLKDKNDLLYAAVRQFQASPSNLNFQNCANAWMASRTPWESSEAFLFGPVVAKGLDPNMDSWPLDANGIVAILKSNKFEQIEWTGEYVAEPEDDSEAATMTAADLAKAEEIAAAQNLRGFHTLEFLVFKAGRARKVN